MGNNFWFCYEKMKYIFFFLKKWYDKIKYFKAYEKHNEKK